MIIGYESFYTLQSRIKIDNVNKILLQKIGYNKDKKMKVTFKDMQVNRDKNKKNVELIML